jgi:hypothetical protein
VLRARPRRCFSERSLTSQTSRRSQVGLPPWTVDTGISPVDFELARRNDGGRVGSLPRRRGRLFAHGVGVTSKRRQKPRKDRASPLGNERRRYRPSARTMPRRCRPRNEPRRSTSNGSPDSESARANAKGARAPGDRSTTGRWEIPSRGGRVARIVVSFGWSR